MRAMTAPSDHLDLAADFAPASLEQWRELVGAVLRRSGADLSAAAGAPESLLSTPTYDGVTLAPLYVAGSAPHGVDANGLPGQAPFVRGTRAVATGWDVRQRHADPDPVRTNAAVLADLENGVTSLWLALGDGGIPIDALGQVLDGVYLDLAPVVLDAGADTTAAADAFFLLAAARGVEARELSGSLGADPIGLAARTGTVPDLDTTTHLALRTLPFAALRAITVDGTAYHDAGGSDSDELAIAASVGVAYLRALTDAGLSADAALDQLEFRYAVGCDQFASIAKLRAARRIWARIAELSGAAPAHRGQHQHAVTSAAMMTRRDPWVNMLRTTIACFAAAVGGAESITVAPFDAAHGLPDDFARRIARNCQSVLHDESSLARVIDPAGGSWFVESFTEQLAAAAWSRFTELERAGGAVAALADGTIASLLATSRAAREDNIAHRRDPITGVSEFANLTEQPLARPAAPAGPSGGLPRIRYAEPFEQLRDSADAHLAEHGTRPTVFLAALGPVAAHTGRVGFAVNLFAAGGLDTVVGTGSVADLTAAFAASGTTVACLCSSEKVYAAEAAGLAAALKAAGAETIWIAGGQEIDSADLDGSIHVGCDALAVLRTTARTLGVTA